MMTATVESVDLTFACFATRSRAIESQRMRLGNDLVRQRRWKRFENVLAKTPEGDVGGGYVGYANAEVAEFFEQNGWPLIVAERYYKKTYIKARMIDPCYASNEERLQIEAERRMQAQRVLGEHVFEMVRKSRAARGVSTIGVGN